MRLGHAAVAGAVTAALSLSGCATQSPPAPYATAAADELQQTVLHVTRAAGDGEYEAARARLEELEVSAKVAHARGELTAARHDSILAAIALVRADLEALIAETEAKAAAAKKKAEEAAREAAEEKAAEEERQAAQQAAQQEASENDDGGGGDGNNKGKENKGTGKGKD